jgi:predicted RNA-binding Zn-ribbon protein involved in translation (DUF1610 family)
MNKNLRLSERLYQRVLWCVAILFAGFLTGFGRLVVGDLPHVEAPLSLEVFIDKQAAAPIRLDLDKLAAQRRTVSDALASKRLLLTAAEHDVEQAQASFRAWATTRHVTDDTAADPEVTSRVRQVDAIVARQRDAQRAVEELDRQDLDLARRQNADQAKLAALEDDARDRYDAAVRRQELRVFGLRLAITLPLLVVAGWLMVRRRQSKYWPFVWGFGIFAVFTFFVELVPYLPSYGGYVRYAVGIAGTLVAGLYLIRALTRYREQQRIAEAQSDAQRRASLGYEVVMARFARKVCPGCERALHPEDPNENFCPHCGICVFDKCTQCGARKNAFARYCLACGSPATAGTETASKIAG